MLELYRIDLYAANRKANKTFGKAALVRFQFGGYELETKSLIVEDAMGQDFFLLRWNF